MSNETPYHYWSDKYRYQGKTLIECYNMFGTGEKKLSPDVRMEFIFLTAKRNVKHIWILRLVEIYFGRNVVFARYERNKTTGSFPLNHDKHLIIHQHKYILPPYYNKKQSKIIRNLLKKGITRDDII